MAAAVWSTSMLIAPQTASAAPPTPTLHYPLTADLTDSVGGAPAAAMGGASVTPGIGVVLDGVDDYLKLPDHLMTGLDEITVSMDVNIRASQATPTSSGLSAAPPPRATCSPRATPTAPRLRPATGRRRRT